MFSTISERPAAISDWSVFEAPFSKTGTVQTRRPSRRKTTMFIGSALSVIATRSRAISVGVVPLPACDWPGFWMPVFS